MHSYFVACYIIPDDGFGIEAETLDLIYVGCHGMELKREVAMVVSRRN